MKYKCIPTLIIGIAFMFSSCKNDDSATQPQPAQPIKGHYCGVLISSTYVTFTGITTIDTLEKNLVISCSAQNPDSVFLSSVNPVFSQLWLYADANFLGEPGQSVYTNAFQFSPNRYYMARHTPNPGLADSLYINTFTPPRGGWNTQWHFYGQKLM